MFCEVIQIQKLIIKCLMKSKSVNCHNSFQVGNFVIYSTRFRAFLAIKQAYWLAPCSIEGWLRNTVARLLLKISYFYHKWITFCYYYFLGATSNSSRFFTFHICTIYYICSCINSPNLQFRIIIDSKPGKRTNVYK